MIESELFDSVGCTIDEFYREILKNRESEKVNKNKIPLEWENIFSSVNINSHRAKVIGGWIVNNNTVLYDHVGESMVFVPDPEHLWEI